MNQASTAIANSWGNIDASCVSCGSTMLPTQDSWLIQCQSCEFLASGLWDEEVWTANADSLDESFRDSAFRKLREANAERILRKLNSIRSLKSQRLLDVGCGPGWFISAARSFGAEAIGIEPFAVVAEFARKDGNSVIEGFFPQCLNKEDRFDLITFNDVLHTSI